MRLGELPAAAVETVFERHGACSVTLTDAGDHPLLEPAPGETPLWPDTEISGLFDAARDLEHLKEELRSVLGMRELPGCRIETLAERIWEREWLKDLGPMAFGTRLRVCPGDSSVADPHAVVVKLDPGLAFGTGTHATTALCLEWLDGLELEGARVLDYGCGSGILSVAALLLGAASVTAVDIDAQAITATGQNAARNGVRERLVTASDRRAIRGSFDCVVANILAGALIDDAPHIVERLARGGELALSGILTDQAEAVRAAYRAHVRFAAPAERDGWIRLDGRRI
ncbi:MAG: 50S ribosomal protein L11 methyltransferase [Woeseiaceae bacterium]